MTEEEVIIQLTGMKDEAECYGYKSDSEVLDYVINRIKALKSGKWIQLSDNVNHFKCSVCDAADFYEDWTPKFCPECGAQMIGTVANKCGSCIHDKEKWPERTCVRCHNFDQYEKREENDNAL